MAHQPGGQPFTIPLKQHVSPRHEKTGQKSFVTHRTSGNFIDASTTKACRGSFRDLGTVWVTLKADRLRCRGGG